MSQNIGRQVPVIESASSGKPDIVSRLNEFIRYAGYSGQKTFAESAGVNFKTLNGYMSGGTDRLCSDILIALCTVHGLNLNWLLCGIGGALLLAQNDVADSAGDYGALPLIKINSDNAAELAEILDSVMALPSTDLARLRQWLKDGKELRGLQAEVASLKSEVAGLRKSNQ